MKKALVLGVLAIFAISIANVNAQDRTNVQAKPKKTYNQEPASKKNIDTKAVNDPAKKDPTAKNVTTEVGSKKIQGTKGGHKVGKPAGMVDGSKKGATKTMTVTDAKEKTAETADIPESKTVTVGKEIKSIPPTPKEKKDAQNKTADTEK